MSNAPTALNGAAAAATGPAGKIDPLAQLFAGNNGVPLDFAALLAQLTSADGEAAPSLPVDLAIVATPAADTTDDVTQSLTNALLTQAGEGLPPTMAAFLATPPVPAPDTTDDVTQSLTNARLAPGGEDLPPGMAVFLATPPVPAPALDRSDSEPASDVAATSSNGRALAFLAALQAQRGKPAEGAAAMPAAEAADIAAADASTPMLAKIAAPAGKADGLPALAADPHAPLGGSASATSAGSVVPAHAAGFGATATPHAAPASPLPVPVPLHDPRWASEVGQKMVWMAKQDLQSAQLSVSPAHLGPIDITLNMGSDGATAVFHSANAEVRDVLEAALPRLREMMSQAGIQLSDARVGAQNHGQPDAQQHGERRYGPNERGGNAILLPEHAVSQDMRAGGRIPAGLVDLFA